MPEVWQLRATRCKTMHKPTKKVTFAHHINTSQDAKYARNCSLQYVQLCLLMTLSSFTKRRPCCSPGTKKAAATSERMAHSLPSIWRNIRCLAKPTHRVKMIRSQPEMKNVSMHFLQNSCDFPGFSISPRYVLKKTLETSMHMAPLASFGYTHRFRMDTPARKKPET